MPEDHQRPAIGSRHAGARQSQQHQQQREHESYIQARCLGPPEFMPSVDAQERMTIMRVQERSFDEDDAVNAQGRESQARFAIPICECERLAAGFEQDGGWLAIHSDPEFERPHLRDRIKDR